MLSESQKQKLMSNWGERSDSLHCNAEVRLYFPNHSWECYLVALDPSDDNTCLCIEYFRKNIPIVLIRNLEEINGLYGQDGEPPLNDPEFRPIQAEQLLRKLQGVFNDGYRN